MSCGWICESISSNLYNLPSTRRVRSLLTSASITSPYLVAWVWFHDGPASMYMNSIEFCLASLCKWVSFHQNSFQKYLFHQDSIGYTYTHAMHVWKRYTSDVPLFFWSLNSSLFPRDPFLWKCGHFGPWSGHPIRRARIQVLVSASVLWLVYDGQTRMDGTSWCLIISLLKSENPSINSWKMGLKIDFSLPPLSFRG